MGTEKFWVSDILAAPPISFIILVSIFYELSSPFLSGMIFEYFLRGAFGTLSTI